MSEHKLEIAESWRVRRARLRLADAEHYRTFLHVPSHLDRQDRKIARLRRRYERLLTTPGTTGGDDRA